MIDEISAKDINESIDNLKQLETFYQEYKKSDYKMEDVWEKYCQLPPQAQYLIASHYRYDQWGWSVMTKWKMYQEFNQMLKEGKDFDISQPLSSAVETQRKIVQLEKLFATLKNPHLSLEQKKIAFQEVKKDQPVIYQEIIHNLWIAHGKPQLNDAIVQEWETPNSRYQEPVIKKMIHLYLEGHRYLEAYFFEKRHISPGEL